MVLELESLETGEVIFLNRLDFLEEVGLKFGTDGVQFLLLISLHIHELTPQFLLLLLEAKDIVLRLGREPFEPIDRITKLIVFFINLLPEFPDLLFVGILGGSVLSFEGLEFELVLGLDFVDLCIFYVLDLLELVFKQVQLVE